VRALGGTLRGHPDPAGRKALRVLAQDANIKVAVAAIAGLAAAGDASDAPFLRQLVADAAADRRRAAAWALGELHDTGSVPALLDVLGIHDDRLVGDAAWALGEIASAAAPKLDAKALLERFAFVTGHGGWASAIDASAGLARTLLALPRDQRTAARAQLEKLAFHKSRLVRINIALALSSLTGDDEAAKALAQLLHDDVSAHVRAAAADGLARLAAGAPKPAITSALDTAAKSDLDADVKARALADLAKPPATVARNEWRNLYVVDVSADDARVRQEPFFIQGDDGLVWASYTDARGELTSEHMPPNITAANVWPASREPEY
jgi:HEAT repeat protein